MIAVVFALMLGALPLRIVEPINTSTIARAELEDLVVHYRTAAIVWRTNAQIERDERERDAHAKQEALKLATVQARLIKALEAQQTRCGESLLPGWIGIAVGIAGVVVGVVAITAGG